MIHSMTGFASRTFTFGGESFKVELRSLNHRFLDLKLRIPRSLHFLEAQAKAAWLPMRPDARPEETP